MTTLSDLSLVDQQRYAFLTEWWTQMELTGDCGKSRWEVLSRIRDEVTRCLACRPRKLDEAEHLTALALLLITEGDENA